MSEKSLADTREWPSLVEPEAGPPETVSGIVNVDLGALSHQGKVRPNNEDHFLVARFERSMQTLLTNLPAGYVPERSAETAYGMLVADGLGGAVAGEVASRMAISVLVNLVLQTPDWIMLLDQELIQEVQARLNERFKLVKQALTEQARTDPSLSGMATTLTLACSWGADLVIGHVGDSRAYRFREGQLNRLTRDHTIAQSLVNVGAIRPEDAATHGLRHVLTNVIGTRGDEVKAEFHKSQLTDGDQILLCTDGLTEMIPEGAIADVLRKPGPAADVCATLVDLALEAGGKDNVTVVLGRYHILEK
jgi:protein phosphatase